MQAETEASSSPPTQEAYKLTTRDDLRNGIVLGALCLIVFAVGVALWVFGVDFITGGTGWRTEFDAYIIALGAPLMLIAAFYFFYTTWKDWKRSSYFNGNKQRVRGVITHLWSDRNANRRKRYNVGYQYAGTQAAYQSVQKRRYDSLSIGDEVWVDYVPGEPALSYFEPIRKRAGKTK